MRFASTSALNVTLESVNDDSVIKKESITSGVYHESMQAAAKGGNSLHPHCCISDLLFRDSVDSRH